MGIGAAKSRTYAFLRDYGVGTVLSGLILVAFGISPEEFIAKIIETPPAWVISPWSRFFIVALGVVIVVWRTCFYRGKAKFIGSPDMTTAEAIDYIAEKSVWGEARNSDFSLMRAAAELEKAAKAGTIEVEGRKRYSGTYEKIPRRYWETSGLDLTRHLGDYPDCRTEPREIARDIPIYEGLYVASKQVKAAWPRRRSRILPSVFYRGRVS